LEKGGKLNMSNETSKKIKLYLLAGIVMCSCTGFLGMKVVAQDNPLKIGQILREIAKPTQNKRVLFNKIVRDIQQMGVDFSLIREIV
jgi:hypothetical protein